MKSTETRTDTRQQSKVVELGHPSRDTAAVLREAIEREFMDLRRAVEVLVWRLSRDKSRDSVVSVAEEVLQETVARALSRAHAFDPNRSAHAWLFGIAINVLRERTHRSLREEQLPAPDEPPSTVAGVRRVHELATSVPPDTVIELLDLVAPPDQEILRLAYVEQLRGPALAGALGIKEGAARVRLSRAVVRLSKAYHRAQVAGNEDPQ